MVFAVLEREEARGDDHGPKRFAILHVGGDGYATFDALFCQKDSTPPYAVLLQNHGSGGNWNPEGFGAGSMLWRLATQEVESLPKWLLVAIANTEPWPGYSVFPMYATVAITLRRVSYLSGMLSGGNVHNSFSLSYRHWYSIIEDDAFAGHRVNHVHGVQELVVPVKSGFLPLGLKIQHL